MTYACEVKQQAAQPVLSIRTRTAVQNLPAVLGECYRDIFQALGKAGQQPAGAPFTAYYNMDMQDLDVEIGFPVAQPLAGSGRVQAGSLPEGRVATCLYSGPYDQVGQAYTALSQWMQAEGLEPTGVAYEHYLNDPAVTPPADLQTRIAFPLK